MSTEWDAARFEALIAGFADRRILVIGDLMLDEYIWGKVSRISPEAPRFEAIFMTESAPTSGSTTPR